MIRVKICGLSEAEHVRAACDAGADFIGMVLAPSRRQISTEEALHLAEVVHSMTQRHTASQPEVVGVFVNLPVDLLNRIADYCQLDWVQLSGDETWQYCQEIQKPIIKSIRISAQKTAGDILADIEMGHRLFSEGKLVCLLDSHVKDAYGGTGQTFDWRVAAEVAVRFPVIVAGGVTPANVGRLIKQVQPWGVDVSTGVESGGRKNVAKIKAFVGEVRKAEA